MAFVGPDAPDEQPFVGPDSPDDTASMTFPQKFEEALRTFQAKLYPLNAAGETGAMDRLLEGATFPFRLPQAVGGAVETMFPGTGEAIANSQAARLLGPIPQVAEAIDKLKFEAKEYDTGLEATGKAVANIGLEVGKQLASPLGVGTALSSVVSAPATAAAFIPTVLDAAESASREIASDAPTQQKLEAAIMASLGLVGTVAGLRANLPKTLGAPRQPAELNPIGKEALQGAAELERIFGNEAPLTPAELSQNPMTARRENFIRKVADADINSTRPLAYQVQQRAIADMALKAIREKADEAGPKSEVGMEAAKQLQAADEALAARAGANIGTAAKEIAGEADAAVRAIGPAMEQTDLGTKIRDSAKFTEANDRAKVSAMYDDANRELAASGTPKEFIDLAKTRAATANILASSLKKDVGGTRQVIPQFLPAFNKIQEIANLTTLQSIDEVSRFRSLIGESIGRLESGAADDFGGGFQLGDLKQIYKAISADEDAALSALAPAAKAKFQAAKSFFKEKVERREQNPILRKIINDPVNGGLANTGEIVGLFARGEGKLADLQAIQEFLPAPDYDALKAGVIDSLRSRSTIPTAVGAVEDLTGFAKSFRDLAPEVKRELLGSDKAVSELQSTLDQFAVVKKGTESIGKTVPSSALTELVEGIKAGNATAGKKKFGEAVAKEQARITDYNNEITKGIRARDLGSVSRNPAQFVDDFLLKSDDAEKVERALQLLDPATRNRVRKLATQTFIEGAFDPQRTTQAQIARGEVAVDLGKLVETYTKNPEKQRVINTLIPEEDKALVEGFLKYQRGIENARKLGGSSGLVAANSVFGGSMGGGLLSTAASILESFARNAVTRKFAEAYFSKRVRPVFELTARGEFLTTSVAAALRAQVNPNTKIPTLTKDGLLALMNQFGVARVQEYLNTKAEVDKLTAQMTEDERAAVLALMPEVATPMAIEGVAANYTPPEFTTGPSVKPAATKAAPSSIEVPMPNRNGRLVNKVMTREEAMKKLEETRAQMQRLRQQLND